MSAKDHNHSMDPDDIQPEVLRQVVEALGQARREWRKHYSRPHEGHGRGLPAVDAVIEAASLVRQALFPMRLGPCDLMHSNEDAFVGYALGKAAAMFRQEAQLEYAHHQAYSDLVPVSAEISAGEAVASLIKALPALRRLLDEDVAASYRGDPAAKSYDEILLCYPGVQVMIYHRLAHCFYNAGLPIIARVINEYAKIQTGIEIHPGAQIGPGCFIDHGTGVAIGETAIVGSNVRLYQGVILGAKSFPLNEQGEIQRNLLRHPIIEDDVIIYANATVLGRVTVGRGSVIAANVMLAADVPPGSFVSASGVRPNRAG